MRKIFILLIVAFYMSNTISCQSKVGNPVSDDQTTNKTIFVYGNGMVKEFINYVAVLTNKKNPKICFFPTAAADDERAIGYWYRLCEDLPIEPTVLKTFISSYSQQNSFSEQIFNSDAIIVGGGSTLNMIAIWKAQGIDTLLRQAYEKGIVLAGGSAGSLCWFTGGYTDSRPQELTLMECLGFLDYSHSPHYNGEPERKPLYHKAILEGNLKPGYACDDGAGLLFMNGEMVRSVTLHADHKNYFVSVKDGKIDEKILPAEILK